MALFSGIGGQVQDAAGKIIDILPDGGLKDWLKSLTNPAEFIGKVITLIKGRPLTTGEYVLGERYLDQVVGMDHDITRGEVTEEAVALATTFFTIVFGVRITTSQDLDSLDSGVDAYYRQPEKDDIPLAAVQRAVMLKQNYFPISTYNKGVWDLNMFEQYPLVAPIPGVQYKTLYTGQLPGGAYARDGVVVRGESALVNGSGSSSTMKWVWIGLGIVAIAIVVYLIVKQSKQKSS